MQGIVTWTKGMRFKLGMGEEPDRRWTFHMLWAKD